MKKGCVIIENFKNDMVLRDNVSRLDVKGSCITVHGINSRERKIYLCCMFNTAEDMADGREELH